MSEVDSVQVADGAAVEAPVVQASAGALLRAAREAAGLHVAALAVSMKVPVKKLEALEADRFDLLPDAVFVRALASSVCRNLKIDPAQVLSRLPHQDVPRLSASERGLNAPFHAAGESRSFSVPVALRQPAVLAVLLLLVAALAVVFFPELHREAPVEETAGPAESVLIAPEAPGAMAEAPVAPPVLVEPVPAPQSAPAVVAAAPVAAPAPAAPVAAVATPAPVVPAVPEAKPVVAAPAAATASAAAATAATTSPAATSTTGQVLVFRVKGPSWVEVTDAKGVVLMRRNLAQGEAAGITGALPLSVVVGRADVTEVEVRGKAFSLAAYARDNVARFEVK